MNSQRKKMIIAEIRYWKEHKLLPAHYCDFLITLYAQGAELDEMAVSPKASVLQRERKKFKPLNLLLLVAPIGSVVGLWLFGQYPIVMMATVAFLIILYLGFAFRKPIGTVDWTPVLYISVAFMFLMLSLKIWERYFNEQPFLLIVLMLVNCFLWMIAGKLLNRLYFTISGIAGVLLIIAFYVWTM